MAEREEWGPWIEHAPGACPVTAGETVQIEMNCGCRHIFKIYPCHINDACWGVMKSPKKCLTCGKRTLAGEPVIVRFRIRRPRALTQLIELVETLPAEKEEVSA